MSSAAKIERIVDKVRGLSACTFSEDDLPPGWFRRILSADGSSDGDGAASDAQPSGDASSGPGTRNVEIPFFPFKTLLITGTAGAGKTSSVQVLAANLDCVITGTTGVAAQNLSTVLNRTKSAQVKTIYRAFGFNSKHVSMTETVLTGSGTRVADGPGARRTILRARSRTPVAEQQCRDLGLYWPVVEDIASKHLGLTDKKRSSERSELCESNVIVIDECGVLMRYLLHVVVFFYYFYNALYDTPLYRRRLVPCVVCVGSPTQTEALETAFDNRTQAKTVRRGIDALTALITDRALLEYCDTLNNWVMFINNKRCTDLDFGDFLRHLEFGLPLKPEHVEYVDKFVQPAQRIRDPSYALDMTRLFLSHAEVNRYFKSLHDKLRTENSDRLFDMPVYCIVNNANFDEYCDLSEAPEQLRRPEAWFRANLTRIINYSQFVDHNLSDNITIERLAHQDPSGADRDDGERARYDWDALFDGDGDDDLDGGGDGDEDAAVGRPKETLLMTNITYIRDSSVGVTTKTRGCVIGYNGTFGDFMNVLQQELFIDRTPCEQAIHAYSLLSGLLYSSMYSFCMSPFATREVLREFADIPMPFIPALCMGSEEDLEMCAAADGACGDGDASGFHDLSAVSSEPSGSDARERTEGGGEGEGDEFDEMEVSDADLLASSELYCDKFFSRYAKPPATSCLLFEEVVYIYTTFRDIFSKRFKIMQIHSKGKFGNSKLVMYNRRNVYQKRSCEFVSQTGSFVGMISFVSPVHSYVLEGFTYSDVLTLFSDTRRIHPRVLERGLPRLVVRDALGFVYVLESNISKFVDSSYKKSLHICTTIDHGITSRTAMTIARSQGLSLGRVAIDFGDNPTNLKLSHIYVAMSRVVNPDDLIMNLNPMRFPYEKNTHITPYICRALNNRNTILIF